MRAGGRCITGTGCLSGQLGQCFASVRATRHHGATNGGPATRVRLRRQLSMAAS